MERLLAFDVGTTAAKAALLDREGRTLASAQRAYPLRAEGALMEQDPALWVDAVGLCAADLAADLAGGVDALVVSGQMQDLIAVDGRGAALGPAVLYGDTRSRSEADRILADFGEDALIERGANLPDPSQLPAKLLARRNAGREEADMLLGAHDYVYRFLSGASVTDYTNASTTGLLLYDEGRWDADMLAYLGLPESRLPRLEAAGAVARPLLPGAAQALGLQAGIPVFHGAGDAGANTLGSGAGAPGVHSCYLGTSGWLAASGPKGRADPRTGIYNLRHPDPDLSLRIGPLLSAGAALEWAVRLFAEGPALPWEELLAEAEKAAPGAGGVFFLPQLSGERSPFRDPDARGVLFGLNPSTGRAELVRAAMEGVAFSLASIAAAFGAGDRARRTVLSGGGARSRLWADILAAVLDCPVEIPRNAGDAGLLGSLLIAGRGLGWYSTWELPASFVEIADRRPGGSALAPFYAERAAFHRTLHPALRDAFARAAKLAPAPERNIQEESE